MIKYILEVMRQNKLMSVVETDTKSMLEIAHALFDASSRAVLEGEPAEFDVYARDREINLLVIKTRKRIVEHLSISGGTHPVGELVFIILINNIERIGDHAKNMYDLYQRLEGQVEEDFYLPQIQELRNMVDGFFEKAEKALLEEDEQMAREVLDGHDRVVKNYECLTLDLLKDEQIKARQAVALTVTLRSLKRVSAHLKTIASSAVSPFMLLGYRQMPEIEPSCPDEFEDDD